jgi:hypothetical protein
VLWEDDSKMDLGEIGWGIMDWIDLAQDRDQWWSLMNTAMNLRVHKIQKFSVAERLTSSQDVLNCVELVSYIVMSMRRELNHVYNKYNIR